MNKKVIHFCKYFVDNDAMTHLEAKHQAIASIQKLRSSFQLPPDPKCSLAVASEFIPLNKVSLKGESPIGQTSQLSINELCNVPPSSWILIEGISGIGKSTLAYEMLKQWKNGTALQNYSLVLLLRLRNKNVHQHWSSSPNVAQLIQESLNEQYCESPEIKNVLGNNGQNLLLILEGYDELPNRKLKFQMQFFHQLKSRFHNAIVIITTQPSLSYQLTATILFTKVIEILGFNKFNQDRYIEMALKNDKALHEKFKGDIKSCPIVAQYLSVPLHLAIMIEIIFSGRQKPLPQTITELYESFVMILICRHSKNDILDHFDSLPQNEKSILQKCCQLAYKSLLKQQIVFDCDESNTLGLMQRESKIQNKDGSMTPFSFLHFKIQEFLSAYHMQSLSSKEQKEHLKVHQRLSTTMNFFAGLTKLQESLQIVGLLSEYIFHFDCLHHLMEIKNDVLVSEVLNENRMIEVSRVSSAITVQDFYVLGRCFALSSCSWRLGFTLRGLSSEHIKMFVSGFNDVTLQSPLLEHIVFSLNPIGNEGLATFLSLPSSVLCTISEFFLRAASLMNNDCFNNCITKFEHFDALKIFLFHDNKFKEGEQQQLIDVLCTLKHLEKVSFSSLSPQECFTLLSQSHLVKLELYEFCLESVEALLASLTQCMTLKCIELYQSPITKEIVERSLRHSLPHCTLNELKLINCDIDSETAILIIDAATHSPTLQVIDLSDNVIDDEGGCYIASKLCVLYEKLLPNPAENITKLFLQHNFFTEKSIEEFTDKLTQLPYNFTIHLSLQWKDYIEKKCRSSEATNVEKMLVINVHNNNLVLENKQQQQHSTSNEIKAPHEKSRDMVSSVTDDTVEDDTLWNKVKQARRGRPKINE